MTMTRGDVHASTVVAVVGLDGRRVYQMANGDELTVVWAGEDDALLPLQYGGSTSTWNAEMKSQRRKRAA